MSLRALLTVSLLVAAATIVVAPAGAETAPGGTASGSSPSGPPAPPAPPADSTAVQLFASVEAAWARGDAERLAALVDTTVVRIGLKPGAPPASAVTRNAATFLFHDQFRLVDTRSFRVVKVEVSLSKKTARAVARWTGDWGGRQGLRDVEVEVTAAESGTRWRLTEVRAND
jgi:hypothetical protein